MISKYRFTAERLRASLDEALDHWHDDTVVQNHLGTFRLIQQQKRQNSDLEVPRAARELVYECLRKIETYAPEEAIAIKKRYMEGNTLQSIASDLQSSVATAKRRSELSVNRLSKMLYDREKEIRDAELAGLRSMLPPKTYDELIGQDEAVEAIMDQLVQPGSPWILALVGVGGIGKSAVADAVARLALETFHFERAIWIRNDQHSSANNPLTMSIMVDVMQRRLEESLYGGERSAQTVAEQRLVWSQLKNKPYLVIIDNLETEADTLMLMEFLRYASEPTKFLVTARSRLLLNAGIYHYPLRELNFEHAHQLLADFSRKLGPFHPEVTKKVSRQIYERVGGHPLAIKLVANLLDVWPLDQILIDFSTDGGKSEREIYRPIYLRVWRVLSPPARKMLQALGQLPPEGAPPGDVMQTGGLSSKDFWNAVEELTDRSLLEIRGTLDGRLYGVHRLTQAFLKTGLMDEE